MSADCRCRQIVCRLIVCRRIVGRQIVVARRIVGLRINTYHSFLALSCDVTYFIFSKNNIAFENFEI